MTACSQKRHLEARYQGFGRRVKASLGIRGLVQHHSAKDADTPHIEPAVCEVE